MVDLDKGNALTAGVNRDDVANALLAASEGMPVGVMHDGDNTMIVNLKVRNADGSEIEDINNIPVWTMPNIRLDGENAVASVMRGDAASVADMSVRAIPWEVSRTGLTSNGRRIW